METIFLQDTEKMVKVHPVVAFSVLDHYARRVEGQRRVIGTPLMIRAQICIYSAPSRCRDAARDGYGGCC